MRVLTLFSFITLSLITLARPAFATEPADSQGYFNCLTTRESRAIMGAKPVCILEIECERILDGVLTPQPHKRQAVCDVVKRNNRCPEASGCLADPAVTEEDLNKVPQDLKAVARDTNDACFKPTASANKLTTVLNEKAAGILTTKPPGPPATSPGVGGPKRSAQ